MVLSTRSLPDGLDLWFERVVKPRLQGAASLRRSMEDVVGCVQHRSDAQRVQQGVVKRLATLRER